MSSLPSTSHIREPAARAMNSGSPPTARKALTGEFTPPGITRLARSKSERLVVERVSGLVAVIGPACGWRCQDLAPVRSLRQLSAGRLPRGVPARTRADARPRSRAETGGRRLKTWVSCELPCRLLGEVGQDDVVAPSRLVEGGADGADAAVHHVRGRDDVGAGPGGDERGPRQKRERAVVVHVEPPVGALRERPAVPVVGVLAEAHIGPDGEIGELLLDRPDRTRDGTV